MRSSSILTAIILLAAAVGCEPPTDDPADSGHVVVLPDSGAPDDTGALPQNGDPGPPYGTSLGRNFKPFTLPLCNGTPYEFYGRDEGYFDARLTVVSMAAGWCGPCRLEGDLMQEAIVEAYAQEDVRVVVAVIQDNDYLVPDGDFCQSWVDDYDLTNPVVIDPDQETQIYFPAGSLPATLIVDSNGVIQHREYGVSTGLETVRAALDRLLAAE